MRASVSVVSVEDAVAKAASGHVVLDSRSFRQRGLRFIHGASRVPWTDTRTGGARSGVLKAPDELAACFAKAGVSWGHPVVVVGAGRSGWGEGARVAWSLAWLAHPDVSWCPLNGAWPSWPRVSSPSQQLTWPGQVKAQLRSMEIHEEGAVLDVRTAEEFAGARRYGEARGGHIPGAVSVPLRKIWMASESAQGTAGLLRHLGIDAHQPVVTICTGGVRSAAAALLLPAGGHRGMVRHADGGMWKWSSNRALPMVGGSMEMPLS